MFFNFLLVFLLAVSSWADGYWWNSWQKSFHTWVSQTITVHSLHQIVMWGNCVSYTPGKLGRSPCVLYNRVGLGEQWLRRAEVGLGTLGPEARLGNAAGTSLRQWRLVKGAGSAVGGLGPTACPLPTGLRGTRSWRPPGRGAGLRDTSLLAVRQVCHQWYTYNMHVCVCVCVCVHPLSHSVVSNSSVTPWTLLARLLHPWDFPGRNTGVGCHFLLQRIFPTQG